MYAFEDREYPVVEVSTTWSGEDGGLALVELSWDGVLDGDVSAPADSTGPLDLSGGACEGGVGDAALRLLLRVDGDTLPYDQPSKLAASLTDLLGHPSTRVITTRTTPSPL